MTQSTYTTSKPWHSQDSASAHSPREIPLHWPNRQYSRFVATKEATWHVQRAGTGVPIVLLHGTGSSLHTWGEMLPLLATHYDVIAIDLPGHGFSTPLNSGGMRIEAVTAALEDVLQMIGCERLSVVGHSAGAAIALRMAMRGQLNVERVVGVNAALQPYGGALAGLFAPLAKSMTMLPFLPALVARRARDLDVVRRMLESTGSTLDDLGVSFYQTLLMDKQHVMSTLRMMADWDLRTVVNGMSDVADRCHLMVADGDEAVPPSQAHSLRRQHAAISLTELTGLGHLAHEERPRYVGNQIVQQLTSKLEGKL